MFILDPPDGSDCAGFLGRGEFHRDMHGLPRECFCDEDFVVEAAQVRVHDDFQWRAYGGAPCDDVFTVNAHQSSSTPWTCAEVLDLPGLMENLTGHYHCLIGGGDVCIEYSDVAGVA